MGWRWRGRTPTRVLHRRSPATLGNSDKIDTSLARFGMAYAEQTIQDHKTLVEAIDKGEVVARYETDERCVSRGHVQRRMVDRSTVSRVTARALDRPTTSRG